MLTLDGILASLRLDRLTGENNSRSFSVQPWKRRICPQSPCQETLIRNEKFRTFANEYELDERVVHLIYLIGTKEGVISYNDIWKDSFNTCRIASDTLNFFLEKLLSKGVLKEIEENKYQLTKRGNELYNKININITKRTNMY